jgi:hypothetical protein
MGCCTRDTKLSHPTGKKYVYTYKLYVHINRERDNWRHYILLKKLYRENVGERIMKEVIQETLNERKCFPIKDLIK